MCQRNIAQCPQCGNSHSKRTKFCSQECYWQNMRVGNYKRGTSIHHDCHYCGKTVSGRTKGKNRKGQRAEVIFCNRDCYDKHRSDIREAKFTNCKRCNSRIEKVAGNAYKYCSIECRVADKKPEPVRCSNCKVIFTGIKPIDRGGKTKMVAVASAKTCSPECLDEFYRTNKARKEKISKAFRAEKHPNWQGGSHYGSSRGPGWRRIAEECRERAGRKCGHCGMTEEQSKAKGWGRLQVNHIVPFWQWQDKQKANRQSNLEALCKSCHTKADWQWRKNNPVQMTLNVFR